MNAITLALKTSGVKLPSKGKRIWLWLKDHPGKTSAEVGKALGMTHGLSSGLLGNMAQRKMVTATREQKIGSKMFTTRYATCLREYEQLPMPSVKKAKAAVIPPRVADCSISMAARYEQKAAEAPAVDKIPRALDNFTLKELRVMRDALNTMFGAAA